MPLNPVFFSGKYIAGRKRERSASLYSSVFNSMSDSRQHIQTSIISILLPYMQTYMLPHKKIKIKRYFEVRI